MKTGGGVFPIQDVNTQHTKGMTLRDYFAGQAMKAMVSKEYEFKTVALMAYKMADAMILERDNRETSDKPLDLRHQDTKPTIIPEHEGNH